MTRAIAGLLLLALAWQDDLRIIPGEPSATRWPLAGAADAEDGEELHLRARRVVRRWDSNAKVFTESLSDGIRRTMVVATKKRFEGALKAAAAGRYGVSLSSEAKELYSEQLALGQCESLFAKTPDDVKGILDIVEKGLSFLDEIERIVLRKSGNSDKERQGFLLRVGAEIVKLEEMQDRSDLTGTLSLLGNAFFHIRNAQIWQDKDLPPPAMDDPPRKKKSVFTDMDMTIERIQKQLATVNDVVSWEIKVSTTLILERLITQAGDNEKKGESLRAAARAASTLAEAAPVPDKDLVRILDKAADRSSDPAETREELRRAGNALVVR